jgi:hypothetical protein
LLQLASDLDPPTSASQAVEITGTYHHALHLPSCPAPTESILNAYVYPDFLLTFGILNMTKLFFTNSCLDKGNQQLLQNKE